LAVSPLSPDLNLALTRRNPMKPSRLSATVLLLLVGVLSLGCISLAPGSAAASPKAGKKQTDRGGMRYTVKVDEFENHSNWKGQIELGQELGTVLTSVLFESGQFIVVGEDEMRAAGLDEQDLTASGRAASGNNTPVTGQLTPAQLIIRGAITHVQGDTASDKGGLNLGVVKLGGGRKKTEINATFYIIDSSTGQVVASKSIEASSNSFGLRVQRQYGGVESDYAMGRSDNLMKALSQAARIAVDWMSSQIDRLPWQGQVVMVQGDKVYINRGSREGVSNGQQLVTGVVKVVNDPTTGEILERFLEPEVARLEVQEVREKLSVCRVLSGDIRRVRERLTVILPTGP
jgi:curli biogenesis system outer membrane secretion channel CsgG